ncbi:MAG TPA: bifunctional 4-hydroxy-2-oxoglutarate aldolase/2-dehydro-3-deoxy-phosphogluconate aldolase [Bryobacteraceae bacterium]|nr:bifunctional 4-hydroxy-2-oxoglutarate aldolase/2-dehydro-3-deoxy-phosphogluconate aldolase [Bryobacteraceae bacterium]
MKRDEVCRRIREVGIVPAIRVASTEDAFFVAETVIAGGIPILEVTMTVPEATEIVTQLRTRHPDAIIGAGSVLDISAANRSLDAGAMFVTSTGFDSAIVEVTRHAEVAAIPGALTPSEIMAAIRSGADMIKLFPCAQVGGAAYLRALHAPFPHVPFIASGGVHQQTAMEFIEAGAAALGVGEDLVPREAVKSRRADWIQELAHRFLGMVQRARAGMVAH